MIPGIDFCNNSNLATCKTTGKTSNTSTMVNEIDTITKLCTNTKIDPNAFDVTISALLIGLGAEKYVDIFRKRNIGQSTLMELTDEDFQKLGIDDPVIRQKLLDEVKNLPIYEEIDNTELKISSNLGPTEIVHILEESGQHLYRVYLSMLANTLAVKKTKNTPDCLLYKDKYASDIAMSTLTEMTTILNRMESTIKSKLKVKKETKSANRTKKILVGTFGSAAIAILAMLFTRSLRELKD